jgi:hypothetical protein
VKTLRLFSGDTMRDMHTLLSDTNLIIDYPQLPENRQGVERIRKEDKEDQRVDSSSPGVELFRGCFIV